MAKNRIREFCGPEELLETKHPWPDRPKVASVQPAAIEQNWAAKLKAVAEQIAAKAENNHVEQLERKVRALEEHCKQLRDGATFSVPVETFSPEPFFVKKAFQVVVRPSDGEFIATLFDANLGMTGDTAEEAVANLKATIVDTFELYEENEATLGPEPKRQLASLRELIQRRT
jgi:hypothetical protein